MCTIRFVAFAGTYLTTGPRTCPLLRNASGVARNAPLSIACQYARCPGAFGSSTTNTAAACRVGARLHPRALTFFHISPMSHSSNPTRRASEMWHEICPVRLPDRRHLQCFPGPPASTRAPLHELFGRVGFQISRCFIAHQAAVHQTLNFFLAGLQPLLLQELLLFLVEGVVFGARRGSRRRRGIRARTAAASARRRCKR